MHTYRYRYHFYILHFLGHLAYMPKIFGIPQNCTCTHIDTHMYRDINTEIQIWDICMFVYIHKHTHIHTHTDVYVRNLRKLLLGSPFCGTADKLCHDQLPCMCDWHCHWWWWWCTLCCRDIVNMKILWIYCEAKVTENFVEVKKSC